MNAVLFSSLLFTAVAMAGGLAHAFELLNKMTLNAKDYLTVQQIYRGWSLLGIPVFGALLSTLALTILTRADSKRFHLALAAFLCILGTQIIFWTFTYPVNQQTQNWTVLPDNWVQLRNQWEYSHAASAALDLVGFVALVLVSLKRP